MSERGEDCSYSKIRAQRHGKIAPFPLNVRGAEQRKQDHGEPAYTKNVIKKFGMQDCTPLNTPVDVGSKLKTTTNKDEHADQQQYQSAIGSLMYLVVSTRPYAVVNLAKFSSKPSSKNWTALKHALRYLKGTTEHDILYKL